MKTVLDNSRVNFSELTDPWFRQFLESCVDDAHRFARCLDYLLNIYDSLVNSHSFDFVMEENVNEKNK